VPRQLEAAALPTDKVARSRQKTGMITRKETAFRRNVDAIAKDAISTPANAGPIARETLISTLFKAMAALKSAAGWRRDSARGQCLAASAAPSVPRRPTGHGSSRH
jgi:hypothetical protein